MDSEHTLEKIVEPRFARLRKGVASGGAAVLHGWVFGGLAELAAGYSIEQMVASRAGMMPVNLVIGIPYRYYRAWVWDKIGATESSSFLHKQAAEILATSYFLAPYLALQAAVGNPQEKAGHAAAVVMFAGLTTNGILGWMIDKSCNWLGVPSRKEQQEAPCLQIRHHKAEGIANYRAEHHE
jgi:hypothetical protein